MSSLLATAGLRFLRRHPWQAWLTVLEPPTITVQPTNQAANLGATITFDAAAAGSAPAPAPAAASKK